MFLVGMHPACLMFWLLCITRFKFLGTLVFALIRDTDYWFVVSAAGLHWPHEDWNMVPLAGTVMWDFFPHLLMSSHMASFFFSLLYYIFSLGPYYFWNVSPRTSLVADCLSSSLSETPLFVLIMKKLFWLHMFRISCPTPTFMCLCDFYCFGSFLCSWSRFVVICVFSAF